MTLSSANQVTEVQYWKNCSSKLHAAWKEAESKVASGDQNLRARVEEADKRANEVKEELTRSQQKYTEVKEVLKRVYKQADDIKQRNANLKKQHEDDLARMRTAHATELQRVQEEKMASIGAVVFDLESRGADVSLHDLDSLKEYFIWSAAQGPSVKNNPDEDELDPISLSP